jgi:hypothetical protein
MSWQQKATAMLKNLSKLQATYNQDNGGVFDPATQTVTPNIVNTPFFAYITKVSNGDIQTGIANAEDVTILAGAEDLTVDVKPNDTITAGGKTYSVKINRPIYAEFGEIALHKIICQVR